MYSKVFIFLIAFAFCANLSAAGNVVCYFLSWTIYRPGDGMYNASLIPPDLCTHINYGFVGLEDARVQIMDDWEANGLEELHHLRMLKTLNPDLKLIVSMGGWNGGSAQYSKVSGDPELRKIMIDSVIEFLHTYRFDGFDLYWYPPQRGEKPDDMQNFITLSQELKVALAAENYSLSVAVSGRVNSRHPSSDFQLGQTVDMINVMAYDYHGDWEDYVGHYAPLNASHLDVTEEEKELNVFRGIHYWLDTGVPANKLNLGIGTYGRGFTLLDPKNTSLYAPALPGINVGYNEICKFYTDYEYFWDDEQQVPHIVKGDQWIGYDDVRSVELKAKFAKSLGLAGLMTWSLDTDDFLGYCGDGKYPLINAMKEAWNES